jgi:uncharacterized protein YkwD
MKLLSFSLFFFFASAVSFASGQIAKVSSGPGPKDKSTTSINKITILKLVNEARKRGCKCGDTYYYPAPALTWNEQLEKAALLHSNDMFTKKYFSHVSPQGDKAGERIERAGYHWMMYGENIGKGFRNEQEVVDGWLKSPGHCKNIMNRDYKEMAVAKAGNYWTQTFGTK